MNEKLRARVFLATNILACAALTGCGIFEYAEGFDTENYQFTACDEGPKFFPRSYDDAEFAASNSTFLIEGTSEEYGILSVERDGLSTEVGFRTARGSSDTSQALEIIYDEPSKELNTVQFNLVGAAWRVDIADDGYIIGGRCD